jgi:hypothetical protein
MNNNANTKNNQENKTKHNQQDKNIVTKQKNVIVKKNKTQASFYTTSNIPNPKQYFNLPK